MKSYVLAKDLMEQRGITAYKLSKETGVPQSTLSVWKSGKGEPGRDSMVKIANYLNVPVGYLLGETNKTDVNDERIARLLADEEMVNYFEKILNLSKAQQKLVLELVDMLSD